MIARLHGEVISISPQSLLIDVNGVGYEVAMSQHDLEKCKLNQTATLFTYLAIRENAQELYGFTTTEAKQLFEKLLSVSGVGPKVALSILNLGEPQAIRSAIASGNVAYITTASGVGKRGAEKIVVELKDKLGPANYDSSQLMHNVTNDDAFDALVALGYSTSQASQALSKVDGQLATEERIKAALKEL